MTKTCTILNKVILTVKYSEIIHFHISKPAQIKFKQVHKSSETCNSGNPGCFFVSAACSQCFRYKTIVNILTLFLSNTCIFISSVTKVWVKFQILMSYLLLNS